MPGPVATSRGRRSTAVIGALAVSLTMAACGGSSSSGDNMTPTAAVPAAPKTSGTTVDMVGLEFKPTSLAVKRGQTVTFTNTSQVTHNVKGKDFFSRVIEPGGKYKQRFDTAGTFKYVCTFHPGMEGTVRVR